MTTSAPRLAKFDDTATLMFTSGTRLRVLTALPRSPSGTLEKCEIRNLVNDGGA